MKFNKQLTPSDKGDKRYYKRAFNTSWVKNLQHKPRLDMFYFFMDRFMPNETHSILDLGVTNLEDPMENIFEYYYPYKQNIVAAGIEDALFLEELYPGLRFVQVKSGVTLPFDDNEFDIGYSGATIEHVGAKKDQSFFLLEFIRVCKRVFLTTPNRWFPIELHTRLPFVHWLPEKIYRKILFKLGYKFYASEKNLKILTVKRLKELVPPGTFSIEIKKHFFYGLPSNLLMTIEKEN